MASLEDLGLFNADIGDETVSILLKLKKLKKLRIVNTKFTKNGMMRFSELPELNFIAVHENQFSRSDFY